MLYNYVLCLFSRSLRFILYRLLRDKLDYTYSFEHIKSLKKRDFGSIFQWVKEVANGLGVKALQMHSPSLEWTEAYNLAR